MIDEWGAVETSDWGDNLVHAKIDKSFDQKKPIEKKEEKLEKTEIEVKKKTKTRNKYKTDDGKTLTRAEVMEKKKQILEGKLKTPEKNVQPVKKPEKKNGQQKEKQEKKKTQKRKPKNEKQVSKVAKIEDVVIEEEEEIEER